MATTDAIAFWTVFLIVFFINIFAPIIASGFNEDYAEYDADSVDPQTAPNISDYWQISALNILLVPFWTLGMPSLMNIIIMIPLRVLAYILLLRMIRGN